MKTIVDIMEMCYDTLGHYCGGSRCRWCDKGRFCYVNVTLIAYDMLLKAGEYH